MKKITSLLLVLVMVLGVFALVGCSNTGDDAAATTAATTEATTDDESKGGALKLGLGLKISASATDASAEANGAGQVTVTAAAVLVDADGKVVKAFIDCSDNTAAYTKDGKAVSATEFKTKYEAGAGYGMVAYGGAAKEWYEQADAFCSVIVGKTADEVKALVAADYKGTEDVVSAGCTIYVSDLALAVEDAIKNATATKATKSAELKLGVATTQTIADATSDAAGSNKLETVFFAAAVDANGKVIASTADSVEVDFTFNAQGKSTFDATKTVLSKRQKGDNYGMVAYGGAAKEWYAQADAFCAQTVGKAAADMAGLMGPDYKGNDDVKAAGCTIYVTGLVKAAAKIG